MSETVLIAETGRRTGSSDSRRLRAEDQIPGVVYGHGMDPISLSVNRRDLRVALSGSAGMNTIIDLTVRGPGGSAVASSWSWDNTYEIVEFTPSVSGTYSLTNLKYRCDRGTYLGWSWRQGS